MLPIFSKKFDLSFLKTAFTLILPISIQRTIELLIPMMDNFMLGHLPNADIVIAAAGAANQLTFLFFIASASIPTGASIIITQYWGQHNIEACNASIFIALMINVLLGLFTMFCALFFPTHIIGFFSPDPHVIALGAQYLSIFAYAYPLFSIIFTCIKSLETAHSPRFAFYMATISLIINIIGNYLLIYGTFGFPALGIIGAAYASLFAYGVQLFAFIIYIYATKKPIRIFPRHISMACHRALIIPVLKKINHIFWHDLLWAFGTTIIYKLYARLGVTVQASLTIVNSFYHLVTIFILGISISANILIGNAIGKKDIPQCIQIANKFLLLNFLCSLVIMLILTSFFAILPLYELQQEQLQVAAAFMVVLIIFTPLKSFNGTIIEGIFRGGGDTFYAMIMDLFSIWCIAIPITYIVTQFHTLPLYTSFFISQTYEIILMIMGLIYYFKKKWIHILV